MKFHFLLFIALMSIFQHIYAQKSPIKWGKIPQKYIEMSDCAFDSGADAVVLSSWGSYSLLNTSERSKVTNVGSGSLGKSPLRTKVNVTYKVEYNYHFRIKILTKEGLDQANIEIPFMDNNDIVNSIKAQVINVVNGKLETTKLNDSKIIEDRNGENYISYKKFVLPQVRVGSIIEYSYTVQSENLYSLRPWYFQGDIPVISSVYEGINNDAFIFVNMLQESYPINKKEEPGVDGTNNTWSVRNVPSMKEEDYVTNIEDYYTSIDFQLKATKFQHYNEVMTNWYDVAEALKRMEIFDGPMNGRGGLSKEEVDKLRTPKTQEGKLKQAYDYILSKYKWNGTLGYIPNLGLKELSKSKVGDGASLNMLLLSTLKKMNIEAYPVLISTRDNGALQDLYPYTDQFNHVIVYANVDGKDLLLDQATDNGIYSILPLNDLNGLGFMITKESQEWINVAGQGNRAHTCVGNVELSADGTIGGSFEFADKSYSAMTKRNEIRESGEEAYFKKLLGSLEDIQLISSSCKEVDNYNVPLVSKVELETKEYAKVLNDFIYINPMAFEAWEANPFKLKERKYPVSFGLPINESYILSMEIPEGYTVEELPEPARVTLNDKGASFSYKAATNENKIQITSRFKVNQVEFPPAEYEQLKEFFNLVIEKHAEQIILKKSS